LSAELAELLDDLRERARMFGALTTVGVARTAAAPPANPADSVRAPSALRTPLAPWPVVPAGDPGGLTDLAGVVGWAGDCRRCKLAGTRTNIVFGQGNPNAELMFIGEAPGADEDEQGLAFVGRAGQLLTDIIEKGMKMSRADVYIANILMCRPPGNRNPEPDEILSCQPFLEKKIELIRPRVIVGLGRFPSQWLMKTEEPIGRIRGRVGDYHGIKVVPTYHPAYLLRTPSAKKDVWEDMKTVLSLLK
jgi:uracil-DNA glycosylase family 4